MSIRTLRVLLVLAYARAAFAQQERALTVNDLFRLEELGSVATSPDGNWLAYVVRRPKAQASHFKRDYLVGNDRGDVFVVSTNGASPSRVTDGATDGSGFWAPAWSPDGRRLSMLSNRDGDIQLWLWDRQASRLRRVLAENVDNELEGEVPIWVSTRHVLVSALPRGQSVSRMTLETRAAERAMREWPRAWKGQLTVHHLDAGDSAVRLRPQGRLLLVDVEAGTSRAVASGRFRQMRLSPDRGFVALLRLAEPIMPDSSPLLPWHLIGHSRRFRAEVVTSGGAVASGPLANVRDVFPGSLAWGPSGAKLALIGYATSDTLPAVFRFDPRTGVLDTLNTAGLDLPSPWRTATAIPLRLSATGDVLVYARAKATSRSNWWKIERSGPPVNVTRALPAVPAALYAERHRNTFVGVAGGQLLRIRTSEATADTLAGGEGTITSIAWPTRPPASGVERIVLRAARGDSSELYEFDLESQKSRQVTRPSPTATLVDFAAQRGLAVFSANDRTGTWLWLSDSSRARIVVETNEFLRNIAQGELVHLEYRSLDNQPLNGWIILPVGYRQGRRYPTVAWVYPGTVYGRQQPSHSINNGSALNLQLFAARGFAVLLPSMPTKDDPHASEPMAELPSGVLSAIDKAVEIGITDSRRMAVVGQSYGGYAVYGLLTQTHRFKAAVALAGVSNLISYYGDFDPRTRFDDDALDEMFKPPISESGQMRMGVPPWADPQRYVRNSPIFFANRVQTPLLIVQGDMDYVTLQQGEQFFTALYRQNKRVAFQRYLGEGHVIQGPANVRDMWQAIIAWLDELLRE
jgi:dipeptidyl aminopeptidase/acylaminoacyl peptidase